MIENRRSALLPEEMRLGKRTGVSSRRRTSRRLVPEGYGHRQCINVIFHRSCQRRNRVLQLLVLRVDLNTYLRHLRFEIHNTRSVRRHGQREGSDTTL
ncbi:unnamed protein product [Linum trigynum]|uniref:Uncharacterized protein n=1 Tax=Linum trigynum TaxID=586398 RepID=A0AAV2CVC1_9ROSI